MELITNDFLKFIIGVDDVNIKDGKATIKFSKNSDRYVCMKLAISFMDEYRLCNSYEKEFLIDEIKKLYEYFVNVIDRAKKLPFGLEYEYDDENQQIINNMKEVLILKGKL